jgi:hypothetical protein
MRLKLFTTEAERQRARTRIIVNFYAFMLLVVVLYGAAVGVHYLLGWF